MDHAEFQEQLKKLRQGCELLKNRTVRVIIDKEAGEWIDVDYESTKQMLDEIEQLIDLSLSLESEKNK